jgi:hypothetical protein
MPRVTALLALVGVEEVDLLCDLSLWRQMGWKQVLDVAIANGVLVGEEFEQPFHLVLPEPAL